MLLLAMCVPCYAILGPGCMMCCMHKRSSWGFCMVRMFNCVSREHGRLAFSGIVSPTLHVGSPIAGLTLNIELLYMPSCRYCMGLTARNTLCKRLASCQIGCKQFCAQHAVKYGGTVENSKCKSPKIKKCKMSSNTYPCALKRTIFHNESAFAEYLALRKARQTGVKRKEILARNAKYWQ